LRGGSPARHGSTKCRRAAGYEDRIPYRIHVGDIIIDENDIFGEGVNIAARLEGIAESGGVCISTVRGGGNRDPDETSAESKFRLSGSRLDHCSLSPE
jgi:class 3 adenylate cyclase